MQGPCFCFSILYVIKSLWIISKSIPIWPLISVSFNFCRRLHQQCRSSGKDGFGSVYKGQLHTGGLIAVKMLENSNFSAVEFINEVSTIGRIHHVNVVQLLGFYSEGSKRALVYEYMPNGSLDRHIFPNEGRGKSFSWEKLHEVALGTARGIEYLHNGWHTCMHVFVCVSLRVCVYICMNK